MAYYTMSHIDCIGDSLDCRELEHQIYFTLLRQYACPLKASIIMHGEPYVNVARLIAVLLSLITLFSHLRSFVDEQEP